MKQTAREREGEGKRMGGERDRFEPETEAIKFAMPCALRLVLGHSNLSGQVINLYALNADFCGLGTKAKSVWHVTEMRARGQYVPRSITPRFPSLFSSAMATHCPRKCWKVL